MIIIGIDENGYGPVLGPLVVTATAFKIDRRENFWQLLNLAKNPDYPEKLVVTDSKKLFSKNSLNRCRMGEKTVFSFFYLLFKTFPKNSDRFLSKILLNFSLFPQLCKESRTEVKPCWEEIFLPLWLQESLINEATTSSPVVARFIELKKKIKKEAGKLRKKLKREKIEFLGLKSICICPFQFNRLVKGKSKSYLNYLQFEKLISYFLQKKEKNFYISADRIGGQKRYLPLLKRGFLRDWNCQTLEEKKEISSYGLNLKGKEATISFLQNGEEKEFSIALSSLFGKYIREIFMKRINKFFQNYNPELKPVSGYRDSLTKNFIKETKDLRKKLKINEECFLRNV